MNPFPYILITIITAAAAVLWLARRGAQKRGTSTAQELSGMCRAAMDQTIRKNANKQKIMELFAQNPELSNADIRDELGVTDRTVVRYMDELERAGACHFCRYLAV
ncbi:MAG: winged helix-turn-helix domain-containing protein [Candidatus Spechtbacterales bacterium]